MLKANKKFSGNLQKDIIELRGYTKEELFPKKIKYESGAPRGLQSFMGWNKEIVVFTDCDTDGLCAAAIFRLYFNEQDTPEYTIHYKVASRNRRGFQEEDVIEIMRDYPSATGIITLDCGITSIAAVGLANYHFIDVLITDHHEPGRDLPNARIINPKIYSSDPNPNTFCGTGLIYWLLLEVYGRRDGAIQYAAIATIADMVPLISDNRYIVQTGMKELRNPKKKYKPIADFLDGIHAFVLTEKDVAWGVAPVINSASRLGKEHTAFDALVMGKPKAIKELTEINETRKKLVVKYFEEGQTDTQLSYNAASMYLGLNENTGVLGLIAMKLLMLVHLPAIAYCITSDSMAHYSMRAPGANKFIELMKIRHPDITGGGHDEAGGFSHPIIEGFTPQQIANEFHEFHEEVIYPDDGNGNIFREEDILLRDQGTGYDIEIPFDQAIWNLEDKDQLRPFGVGFEEPIFVSNDVIFIPSGETKVKKVKKYMVYQDVHSDSGAVFVDYDNQISGTDHYDIAYKISHNIYFKGPQIEIIEMIKR